MGQSTGLSPSHLENMKVGVSILTNGNRLNYLQTCISSFLENCHYRPLVISIFDNGSTDGTKDWLNNMPHVYGVGWRVHSSPSDMGCAEGTNRSIEMVNDCEYVIHLESDFEHISSDISGEDKRWLHRAIDFMDKGTCDYIYLRKMVSENDIFQHWWSQWMGRIDMAEGKYLRCPGFWWSNNPTLFRVESLRRTGTLPLDVAKDGQKGTPGWSKPELEAPKPPKTWIHKWGLFVHEGLDMPEVCSIGCKTHPVCKYGFFKDGSDAFCACCDSGRDFRDMDAHTRRLVDFFQRK